MFLHVRQYVAFQQGSYLVSFKDRYRHDWQWEWSGKTRICQSYNAVSLQFDSNLVHTLSALHMRNNVYDIIVVANSQSCAEMPGAALFTCSTDQQACSCSSVGLMISCIDVIKMLNCCIVYLLHRSASM
jgi:hypothetical protein